MKYKRQPVRKEGERGFALLIVFLFAAAVALMLYQQMPRVAFESERDKEQVLQDRGHEYVRAIQLYYVAFKKYPTKIEDLENTNNKRFLRRRYVDPMTGKDEWRLVHVNAGGQLTDSLVQKPPTATNGNSHDANNPLAAFGTGAGSTANPATPGSPTDVPAVNAAVGRRPSDNTLPTGGVAAPVSTDPNDPRNWPPTTTVPVTGTNGQPQFPGQFPGQFPTGQFPGQVPTIPGQTVSLQGGQQNPTQYPGQQTGALPGGFQPGLPGQNQFPPGAFPSTNNPNPTGQAPPGGVLGGVMPTGGVYGFPQNGQTTPGQTGQSAGSATDAINNALRNPNQQQTGNQNAIGAGGLVGVASMHKGPSIKIYKDRQKYEEWEFVFDLKQAMQGQQGQVGLGQGGPNANPGNTNATGLGGGTGAGSSSGSTFSPIFPTTGTQGSPIVH